MPNQRTSTLYAAERALRLWVLAATYASFTMVALALTMTVTRLSLPLWIACAIPALVLEVSNAYYLRTHALPTVGMVPVALFALISPCCACLALTTRWSILRCFLCLMLFVLVLLVILFAYWFWRLRHVYSTHPDIAPDAVLIVLGGAIKQGRPCETLSRRLDVAEALWRQCTSRTLVLTGGPTPDGRTTEAREMARYLQERGVDTSSMLLEVHARNTRENLMCSIELLNERGHNGQLCVVSSDYHLWRAVRDARTLGIDVTPVAAPTPVSSMLQQWCREALTILSGH